MHTPGLLRLNYLLPMKDNFESFHPGYRKYVRHRLPRLRTVLNGVVTRAARLLDPESCSPDHKRQHSS